MSQPVYVVFVGVGGVNFGSTEGPWNHASRLEAQLGDRLQVVALVSPSEKHRADVLKRKLESPAIKSYEKTVGYDSVEHFLEAIERREVIEPSLVLIGIPPAYHGSREPGKDIEIQLAKRLPNVCLFVEKPISSSPVQEVFSVGHELDRLNSLVICGYFMRHMAVVRKAKEILAENKLRVMATVARYCCTYSSISKHEWWMKSVSGAPIVEQGTHFCDLSRYFGGDVVIDSVRSHTLEHYEEPGKLSKVPVDENAIEPEDRIPRFTSAAWKYQSGAVGSMVHGVNLQGLKYSAELEIHADGYMLRIVEPYTTPELHVRSPENDEMVRYTFPGDDPYDNQIKALLKAHASREPTAQCCSWQDATKTYELTKRIASIAQQYNQEALK